VSFAFSSIGSLGNETLEESFEQNATLLYLLNSITLAFAIVGVYIEGRQLVNVEFGSGYWGSFWNYLDIVGIVSSLLVTMCVLCQSDFLGPAALRFTAAVGSMALISKTLLEWLRLFDGTAFYIKLIQEAIADIAYFMIIFLVTIFLFGVPTALIALNWGSEGEEDGAEGGEAGSEGLFKISPYTILYQQYLIALGEFPLDDWEDGLPLVWVIKVIFLVTTFLQTITMLNVLIAIMMESFNRINNNAMVNNNKMKINTISELEHQMLPDEFKRFD